MTIKYRTKDGQADYEFSFERQPGGDWRAYIVSQPSYGSRLTDADHTHRLTDRPSGRKYVCWDRPIRSQADLKQVVAVWSDLTQRYIRYGIPIERP
ncbi:MAG TPA: hypothetical protein VNF47_17225 [Streptosporangiaceae bacterium]|nr:hypothetical protein [Streptosporangiaceae bacterium]